MLHTHALTAPSNSPESWYCCPPFVSSKGKLKEVKALAQASPAHSFTEQMGWCWGFPGGSTVKNLPANAGDSGDTGSIPGWGRSRGGGHYNPLQHSCLENPMDRGAWQAMVHGVEKSWTRLSDFTSLHSLPRASVLFILILTAELILFTCCAVLSRFSRV